MHSSKRYIGSVFLIPSVWNPFCHTILEIPYWTRLRSVNIRPTNRFKQEKATFQTKNQTATKASKRLIKNIARLCTGWNNYTAEIEIFKRQMQFKEKICLIFNFMDVDNEEIRALCLGKTNPLLWTSTSQPKYTIWPISTKTRPDRFDDVTRIKIEADQEQQK